MFCALVLGCVFWVWGACASICSLGIVGWFGLWLFVLFGCYGCGGLFALCGLWYCECLFCLCRAVSGAISDCFDILV